MNDERLVFVTEDEAARVWKRAAELQVKESRRVEERSRDLPPSGAGMPAGRHLTLADVLLAAREVGLDEAHLATAVAELREERLQGGPPAPDLIERTAARFFGSPPPALEASSEIGAGPAEVYRILQVLLPGDPYRLRLRGVMGDDPLKDGVLVFDAPAPEDGGSYAHRTLMADDRVSRLYVTLRAAEGREGRCRIALRGRINADPEPAFWMGALATGVGALATAGAAAVIAAGVGLAGGWVVGPAVAAGALGGATTYGGVRARYLRPLVRGLDGLDELLEVIDAAVRTQGRFLGRAREHDPGSERQVR